MEMKTKKALTFL